MIFQSSFKIPRNAASLRDKLWRAVSNPWWLGTYLLKKMSPLIKSDSLYTKWEFFLGIKRFPDLKNPRTYNEKLLWLKLNTHEERYTRMVDKAEAKEYAAEIIGHEHIIPTLGVWDSFDEIDFDSLPFQFVLKTTHDSGGVVICRDKSNFDLTAARRKLNKSLRHNFFLDHREYPYKNVKPRIIAEQYMEDEDGKGLKDYKFFCFNGEPRMMFIATNRPVDTRFDFFDMDFNHLPFAQGHPWADGPISKPVSFEQMRELAWKLAKGLQQVRVDFYDINGQIYFGELTFFHFSGNCPFQPVEWDERIGSWWTLEK